ncbi:MAG: MFS transporter [Erythrobacter sp. RIFCSPHIGHO2_12_FULL_63_10]|nr:MAG: MFS transporter [Erythrobacter sp. RIFCSPHIGHO2_12_FULL_63_10]
MIEPLVELFAANIAFVGSHFAMSHPLRAPMVQALGERGFQATYSLVSLAAFVWVILAYQAAPTADLSGSGEAGWIVATIVMLPALVLLAGSFSGNPALPLPGAKALAGAQAAAGPRGVFRVTRHPMMWAFGLWALSHIILLWSWRSVITAGAIGLLALLGAHLQDRKKQTLMGDSWKQWESRTSYWPRFGQLVRVGPLCWVLGLMLWVLISWAHWPLAGVPAGIWRWF